MLYNVLMQERPQLIKDFSKEQSGDERNTVAKEVREQRQKIFEARARVTDESIIVNSSSEKNESELARQLDAIHELEEQIESASDSLSGKIKNYFKIKSLREELVKGKSNYEELAAQRGQL